MVGDELGQTTGRDPASASPRRRLNEAARGYARVQTVAMSGMEFGGVIIVLALLGWWLDDRWGTSPWLVLTGTLVGIIGGLYKLANLQRQMYAKRDNKHPPK